MKHRARIPITALFLLVAALPAIADDQPYAGQQGRTVKALSDQEIRDLNAGAGMGLAKAAELNGYPGPRHVLDLAGAIGLSAEQKTRMRALFEAMKAQAMALGADILAKERALDRLFANGTADVERVRSLSREIGVLRGRLRAVHLTTHLTSKPLLSRHQVLLYNRLRGYTGSGYHDNHGGHGTQ